MSTAEPRIFVTGATGQLGRLVIHTLLRTVPAGQVVAGVRDAESASAQALNALGVEVRVADYKKPDGLGAAFKDIDRLLLISSSDLDDRATQHRNVVDAAKAAGVAFLAYTGILHADTSPLGLAEDHRQTEAAIRASGLPFAVLRNGWYTENYAASIPPALQHGAFLGSAGEGRIASASRQDYAEAAAAALTSPEPGRIYELAGDGGYTLSEFAEAIATASGKPVVYKNLPQAEFEAVLLGAGLPAPVAALLADSDAGAAKGALFDDKRDLSRLIGHPTTPMATTVAEAVKSQQ